MNENKKLAVDWFIEKLKENCANNLDWGTPKTEMLISNSTLELLINEAKELQKQQMIDFGFNTYYYISGIMKVPFNQVSENNLHAEMNFFINYENNNPNTGED